MLEWQRDWAHKETYDAVMDIVKNHYGAYGIGVEYAYTMVHGAPPRSFPSTSFPTRRSSSQIKDGGRELPPPFSKPLENEEGDSCVC